MSFPSFLFNADAYTGDTPHLTCEEHGAYLQLMLAYYRSERPLPARDQALASICKLPLDRWLECKVSIAPFFAEADGIWRHDRIEIEIANRNAAVEKHRTRAKAGASARWNDKKSPRMPQAFGNPSLILAESKLNIPPLCARASDGKEESGDNPSLSEQVRQSNPLGAAYRELVDNGIVEAGPVELSPVSTSYWPPPPIEQVCLAEADASTFHLEVQKFIFRQQENGALSADWDASFQLWWTRHLGYKRERSKPKPRIEVNSTSAEEGESVNWDWYVKRWLTNQSTWSRRAGPEPGQPGCRVPAAVFEKHGIDPATGLKAKGPTG